MKNARLALGILVSLLATNALAYTLGVRAENGDGLSSGTVRLSHSISHSKPGFHFESWRVSAEGNRTESSDGSRLNGRGATGELVFTAGDAWEFSANVDSTATPEIQYTQRGGTLGAQYSFLFKNESAPADSDDEDDPSDDFTPKVSVRLTAGGNTTKQDVSVTVLSKTVNRTMELQGRSNGLEIAADLLEWFSVAVSATKYSYDKDTAALTTATQSRFLNLKTGELINTIYGLPESSSQIAFSFYPHRKWDIDLTGSRSTTLIDPVDTNTVALDVVYHWNRRLDLEGGAAHTITDGHPSDTLTVGLSWTFSER